MDQNGRTGIARGGLSLLLAGGIVGVVSLGNLPVTTLLVAALVVAGVAALVAGHATDRPVLLAVWIAPVVAGAVLYVFGDGGSGTLFTQAALLAAIGVAQLMFSQVSP